MRRVLFFITILSLLSKISFSYALSVETHMAINSYITENNLNGFSLDTYLKDNLGIQAGKDEKMNSYAIWQLLRDGGKYEDKPPLTIPYLRSVNHFHNPLTEQGFSGFVYGYLLSGDSSVGWAQKPEGAQEPGGYYSWHDVRDYYYRALTSIDQNTHNTYFAQTFRGLGQLMHLVQDLSVPEHTRDDFHLLYNYEDWVKGKANIPNYTPVFFDLTALGQPSTFQMAVVPIANLFDTNQYTLATGPNATSVPNIGLAEYTGANFLSWDTIFTASYPYPRIESTELWTDPLNNRQYLRKTTEGVPVDHLAAPSFLYFYRLRYFPQYQDYLPLGLDSKVYENYATLLLPRAIGYSSSLLDYFFRGDIELTPPDRFLHSITAPGGSFTDIRLKARNIKRCPMVPSSLWSNTVLHSKTLSSPILCRGTLKAIL